MVDWETLPPQEAWIWVLIGVEDCTTWAYPMGGLQGTGPLQISDHRGPLYKSPPQIFDQKSPSDLTGFSACTSHEIPGFFQVFQANFWSNSRCVLIEIGCFSRRFQLKSCITTIKVLFNANENSVQHDFIVLRTRLWHYIRLLFTSKMSIHHTTE